MLQASSPQTAMSHLQTAFCSPANCLRQTTPTPGSSATDRSKYILGLTGYSGPWLGLFPVLVNAMGAEVMEETEGSFNQFLQPVPSTRSDVEL